MKKIKAEVCTLFEGSYHIGVAALINSLCAFNYKGNIWIGYRGDLPPWIKQFNSQKLEHYLEVTISADVKANFIYLDTDIHFTNYKPYFLIKVKDLCAENIKGLLYFDPDIIVNQTWAFYENWISYGVALCEDPSLSFNVNHPLRKRREELLRKSGFEILTRTNTYYNAGFIGVTFANFEIVEIWIALFEKFLEMGLLNKQPGWHKQINMATEWLSKVEDQDILNLGLSLFKGELSTLGSDGMGFSFGFNAMFHFVGQPKPWNRRHINQIIIKGKKVSQGQKMFIKYLRKPIKIYPIWKIGLKKVEVFLAVFLSRFIG